MGRQLVQGRKSHTSFARFLIYRKGIIMAKDAAFIVITKKTTVNDFLHFASNVDNLEKPLSEVIRFSGGAKMVYTDEVVDIE